MTLRVETNSLDQKSIHPARSDGISQKLYEKPNGLTSKPTQYLIQETFQRIQNTKLMRTHRYW